MTEIKEEGALTGCGASGFLWVTAPAAFGRKVVTPVIPRLLSENPELRINFELTDSVVDIVAVSIECRCASGGYEILAYRRTFSEGPLWVTSGLCQGERLVKVTEPRRGGRRSKHRDGGRRHIRNDFGFRLEHGCWVHLVLRQAFDHAELGLQPGAELTVSMSAGRHKHTCKAGE